MSEQATIDREAEIRSEVNAKWTATSAATKELTRAFIAADGANGANAEIDWNDLEMMQSLAESIDGFARDEKRPPRCMAEINAWMSSADEFTAYVLANPAAQQVVVETTKIDPMLAARQAEQEKAVSDKLLADAEKVVSESAKSTAAKANLIIASGRGQLAELGAIYSEHFELATKGGLITWDDARNKLTAALALETGESLDIGRPMQVHAAANFFGRAAFIVLPKDTQRAFGALFELTDCLDDAGKVTGAKRYELQGLCNNDAIRACKFARGQEADEVKKFLPGARFASASSGGHMHQDDARRMLAIIARAAFSADANKPTDDVTAKPAALASVAKAVNQAKEQEKLDRSKHREKVKLLLERDASGEASPAVDGAPTTSVAKPAGSAVEINEALKDVGIKVAFAKSVEKEVLADVLSAFGEAGRLADMQYLHKILAREILLARHIADNGGPSKCTRKQAREAIRVSEEAKRAAK